MRVVRQVGDVRALPENTFGASAITWWAMAGLMVIEGTTRARQFRVAAGIVLVLAFSLRASCLSGFMVAGLLRAVPSGNDPIRRSERRFRPVEEGQVGHLIYKVALAIDDDERGRVFRLEVMENQALQELGLP